MQPSAGLGTPQKSMEPGSVNSGFIEKQQHQGAGERTTRPPPSCCSRPQKPGPACLLWDPARPTLGPWGPSRHILLRKVTPRRGLTSSKTWKVKPGTAAGSGLHWPEATAATATRPGPGRPPHPDPGIAIVLPSPRPPGSLPVTTRMHTCTHIHACAQCTCVHVHMRTGTHSHVHVQACSQACILVLMCTCMQPCTHTGGHTPSPKRLIIAVKKSTSGGR